MQLKTDDQCRLTSPDLFKPNASYEAERTPDGSIKLVESVSKPSRKAKFIEEDGEVFLDIGRPFDLEEFDKALEDYL
ncbi:MAG TPA: hypothetical protein DCY13_10565 [Verrucomicrobiales bacterium]|nr:hypothetical protein [Verrucomicrobiales bacterium]